MQAAEEFMKKYIQQSAQVTRREQKHFLRFRARFYTQTCPLGDGRAKRLGKLSRETETLLSVACSGDAAEAITRKSGGGAPVRLRYILKSVRDGWRIQDMELEC